MSFKLVVEIKVVNESGDVVDHRGVPQIGDRKHTPLHTLQEFREFAHIENAQSTMNTLHATVKRISEL